MKKGIIISLVFIMILVSGCGKSGKAPEKADTAVEKKIGYAVGYDMATRMRLVEISDEIDVEALVEGLQDALKNEEAKIGKEERDEILKQFQDNLQKKELENRKQQGEKNKIEGKAYLDRNAKNESVTVTNSGLQYEVIREGTGPSPKATDTVRVHYSGTLIDGTEFDSSYKRGEPTVFKLDGIIAGWQEGLRLMNVGSKYHFVVPPELAYGEQGVGNAIPPHAVLVFDIELIGIENPEAKEK